MSAKQKDNAQYEFTNNPDIKVFVGNLIAAGVGLTLTVANKMIFNSFDFVPSNSRQMEDRIFRISQTKDVDIYYQIFRDTQYEKMWNIVMRNELVINQVIKKEDEK
jgi:SWI/SNF-related matrix-associated actin-dependent regulator 1 of chromatin subfamily A